MSDSTNVSIENFHCSSTLLSILCKITAIFKHKTFAFFHNPWSNVIEQCGKGIFHRLWIFGQLKPVKICNVWRNVWTGLFYIFTHIVISLISQNKNNVISILPKLSKLYRLGFSLRPRCRKKDLEVKKQGNILRTNVFFIC